MNFKKILIGFIFLLSLLFFSNSKVNAQIIYNYDTGDYYIPLPPLPPPIPPAPKSDATTNFTANDDGTYDVLFKWTDDRARRYSLAISKYQWADPGSNPDTTIPTWTFHHVPPGIWYVNMKFEVNGVWSQVTAWKVEVPRWVAPTPTPIITPPLITESFIATQDSGGKFVLFLSLIIGLLFIVFFVQKYKEKLKSVGLKKGILFIAVCLILIFFLFPRSSENSPCNRSSPYPMPPEFQRALSLRDQRLIENGTVFLKRDIRNCLDIQYADLSNTSGVEGVFLFDPKSTINDLHIYVDNSYHGYDDILTAILLSHEMTHVSQFINYKTTSKQISCVDKEVEAFQNELYFILSLNSEEKKSIIDRVSNNPYSNNAYFGVYQLLQVYLNSQNNCGSISNNISRNSDEFKSYSQCYWNSSKSQLQSLVEQSPYYQKQCNNRIQSTP